MKTLFSNQTLDYLWIQIHAQTLIVEMIQKTNFKGFSICPADDESMNGSEIMKTKL